MRAAFHKNIVIKRIQIVGQAFLRLQRKVLDNQGWSTSTAIQIHRVTNCYTSELVFTSL